MLIKSQLIQYLPRGTEMFFLALLVVVALASLFWEEQRYD